MCAFKQKFAHMCVLLSEAYKDGRLAQTTWLRCLYVPCELRPIKYSIDKKCFQSSQSGDEKTRVSWFILTNEADQVWNHFWWIRKWKTGGGYDLVFLKMDLKLIWGSPFFVPGLALWIVFVVGVEYNAIRGSWWKPNPELVPWWASLGWRSH